MSEEKKDLIGEREEIDLIHDWLGLEGAKHLSVPVVEPTYAERREYANKWIGLDKTNIAGEDLLTAISLINAFVVTIQKTNPKAGPREVIASVCGKPSNQNAEWIRERVALMCELFLVTGSKFRTFGLGSKAEVIAEINRVMDSWIPF